MSLSPYVITSQYCPCFFQQRKLLLLFFGTTKGGLIFGLQLCLPVSSKVELCHPDQNPSSGRACAEVSLPLANKDIPYPRKVHAIRLRHHRRAMQLVSLTGCICHRITSSSNRYTRQPPFRIWDAYAKRQLTLDARLL